MERLNISCENARNINERILAGTVVETSETTALELHLTTCVNCRVDVSLRQLAASDDQIDVDELTLHRQIDQAIITAATPMDTASRLNNHSQQNLRTFPRLLLPIAAIIVAALLVAAVVAIFTGTENRQPFAQQSEIPLPRAEKTRITSVPPAKADGKIPSSPQLSLAAGVDVEVTPDTLLEMRQVSPEHLHVFLSEGRITAVVNPEIPHPFFVIETPLGTVSVKGTIFSVTLSEEPKVEVFRGRVAVAQKGFHTNVGAGTGFHLKSHVSYPMSPEEAASIEAIAHRIGNRRAPGSIGTVVDTNGIAHEVIDVPVDTTHSGDAALHGQATPPSFPLTSSGQKSTPTVSVESLLSEARKQKGARNWAKALDAYEHVIQWYPRSSQARYAHLAAGNLRLKFGHGEGALKHFDAYLSESNAPLQEEALLGKIKSLRLMNAERREQASMQKFLSLFPDSIHAPAIRKRLTMLELLN